MLFNIKISDNITKARLGVIETNHGQIETPVFMPVGTQGTVKGLTPIQVEETGAQIILGNTYHLNLRPGSELISKFGGLHQFMGWNKPILTDSGGFQVFSLSKLRKITDDGIQFQSHIDGKKIFLGPEEVMNIQRNLNSDITMVLDECPPYPCKKKECEIAVNRSLQWANDCMELANRNGIKERRNAVFGIVQGSIFDDIRIRCAQELSNLDFDGIAIGGVSVGEPEEEMLRQVKVTSQHLPSNKPRYVMGVGTPPQLLRMIAMGIDMFDCVMPTRAARHGTAYTPDGVINIKNSIFKDDHRPLVESLNNYTCNNFSRSYLRHLILSNESLAGVLLSIHNLHFYCNLMDQVKEHIKIGDFDRWHKDWINNYIG